MPKTNATPAAGTVRGSERYDRSGQRDCSEATSHPADSQAALLSGIGEVAAMIAADPVFRRQAERVCRTPRLATELLAELAAEPRMEPVVRAKLERYSALPASALAATGGDRFPPAPLHEVQP